MIDGNGYRSNVGIVLANAEGKVLWAKRVGQDAWQFPQGGMRSSESPEEALYRELYEDCLLYTSPSPRDVEESRMPSSA